MQFLLIGTAAWTALSLLLCATGWLLFVALRRRRPRRFWRRTLLAHLVLIPVYALLGVPATLGYMATRLVDTRRDERAYAGPEIDGSGRWLVQDRVSLAERDRRAAAKFADRNAPDPGSRAPESAYRVALTSADGIALRAFLVPPIGTPRHPPVVLVHGLFRGALELEAVGRMFRALGCEVLLLELRNHGGSGRSVTTFGDRESGDVLAAVDFLRSRPGHAQDPVVLFGVSLGSVAVALAAPQVDKLAGLVLDAPLDNLRDTGERMLNLAPRAGRRRIALPAPIRWLVLEGIEWWAGVDLAAIRPPAALRRLPANLPALIVGGGEDLRAPPDVVREVYEALPSPPGIKELWIREGSDHGSVWVDDPAAYRAHLAALLDRVR